MGEESRMDRYVLHLFPPVIDDMFQFFEAFDVILFGSYHLNPFLLFQLPTPDFLL
jgi:hypothetical protein